MTPDRPYYEAYDERYKAIHKTGAAWFTDTPTPILGDVMTRYAIPRETPMLELGCGEGRDAGPLLAAGYDLLATDVSAAAVAWCRERWPDHAGRFAVLDAVRGELEGKYPFLFAVAVVHMLLTDEDRAAFYSFVRDHLTADGIALLCSMGDGETDRTSDPAEAFALREREHDGKTVRVAGTSCRMVSWETWERELSESGLAVREKGMTSIPGEFPEMMYVVVDKTARQDPFPWITPVASAPRCPPR